MSIITLKKQQESSQAQAQAQRSANDETTLDLDSCVAQTKHSLLTNPWLLGAAAAGLGVLGGVIGFLGGYFTGRAADSGSTGPQTDTEPKHECKTYSVDSGTTVPQTDTEPKPKHKCKTYSVGFTTNSDASSVSIARCTTESKTKAGDKTFIAKVESTETVPLNVESDTVVDLKIEELVHERGISVSTRKNSKWHHGDCFGAPSGIKNMSHIQVDLSKAKPTITFATDKKPANGLFKASELTLSFSNDFKVCQNKES